MARHAVARLAEVPPGSRLLVSVKGQDVCVFNIAGELFSVANRCPHAGAPLCSGKLTGLMEAEGPGEYRYSREGEILRCPWHGWEFDIRTGKSCVDPNKLRIRNFAVDVVGGEEMPEELVATTFPVTVDDSYIVIEA